MGIEDLVKKAPKERSPEDKARVEAMKARIAAGQKPPAPPAAPVRGATSPEKILEIAKEVIQGKWDVGQARIDKLKAAGFDPDAIQKKVNELLK